MKLLKTAITTLTVLASLESIAAPQVQTLKGRGIDGTPCSVTIVRDGDTLKSVQLQGSAKVFEILAENGSSIGPDSDIQAYGGAEIFRVNEENKNTYAFFSHSENLFSNGEVFKFNSKDMPASTTGEDALKGVNMVVQLGLDYDGDELVRVKAQNKIKALWVATLASSQFTCQK
ncbi:MAG: hypothetical protein OM95_12285 [Bdellovibrio sp. ArHS]|uniref:hypothetical protein n=1 Tax=Bdellovibrio sp. ArHS TaxID=1569284 RepID=UPI000583AC4D|nr:hypothetical protein [Bdellovibrio sp. ArHS]KHD87787.1 MAG: hypothetical protein OM95_12285 [Bdellovibrio sp. ArHS]